MSERVTAGDVVVAFLESCGVEHAFGVISIHNMPVLDAFHRRKKINFIPTRSEGGAVNMADANARARGCLGVAVSNLKCVCQDTIRFRLFWNRTRTFRLKV